MCENMPEKIENKRFCKEKHGNFLNHTDMLCYNEKGFSEKK